MSKNPKPDLQRTALAIALSSALLVIAGCSSDDGIDYPSETSTDTTSGDTSTSTELMTISLDATAGGLGAAADDAANKFTYFDLESGAVVELSDTEALDDTDWDIAFKRTAAMLNGGESGPALVTGGLADAQDEYYVDGEPDLSVFAAATADTELASLEAVTSTDGITMASDSIAPAIVSDGSTDSWWLYDSTTHAVSANTEVWNIVRGADGSSYAQVNVTAMDFAAYNTTVELYIQGADDTAFATAPVTWDATVAALGEAVCYDFDTTAEVDCTTYASSWDLQIHVDESGRSIEMWTNGGVKGEGTSGAAFGPLAAADMASYASADTVPSFFSDTASTVLTADDSTWYAYNLEGSHKLWPNYRVYVVDTGTAAYKLQMLSYYDDAGTSGVLSFRYQVLP